MWPCPSTNKEVLNNEPFMFSTKEPAWIHTSFVAATYKKIHLFGFSEGESKHLTNGDELVCVPTPLQAINIDWFSIARAFVKTFQCSILGTGQPEVIKILVAPFSFNFLNNSGNLKS